MSRPRDEGKLPLNENGFCFQLGGQIPNAAPHSAPPDITHAIAARGFRLTRQRRAVIEAVKAAPCGGSPLQIFDAARQHCPDIGLTTVYRTLEVLDEVGALRRVHGPNHCDTYVFTEAHHGHSVVCSECGRVDEFTHCDMSAVIEAAAKQTGYRITEHVLQLNGVCSLCQNNQRTRKDTER